MSHRFLILLSLCLLLVSSCQTNPIAKEMPTPKIKGSSPQVTEVPLFKEFVAQVYGRKDIPIRARVDGYLEGIHFKEGFKVTKGQKLYSIDSQPFDQEVINAQSTLVEAQVQQINAENDLKRVKPLAAIDAVSQRDLDAAQAQFDASKAKVKAATAKLELAKINLAYTNIVSPITGLIGKTQAKVGEYVGREPNPVILNTVSLLDTVYVEFFLNENDYLQMARIRDKIKDQEEAEGIPNLELKLSDGSTFEHPGKLRFVDRGLDPSTGSILIQASFPNPEKLLRPGQFARVRAFIGRVKNVYLVPQTAVSELQGKHTIWVADKDNLCKKKFVEMLGQNGTDFIVRTTFEQDDRILLEGIQKIKADLKVEVILEENTQANKNQQGS